MILSEGQVPVTEDVPKIPNAPRPPRKQPLSRNYEFAVNKVHKELFESNCADSDR